MRLDGGRNGSLKVSAISEAYARRRGERVLRRTVGWKEDERSNCQRPASMLPVADRDSRESNVPLPRGTTGPRALRRTGRPAGEPVPKARLAVVLHGPRQFLDELKEDLLGHRITLLLNMATLNGANFRGGAVQRNRQPRAPARVDLANSANFVGTELRNGPGITARTGHLAAWPAAPPDEAEWIR